ncbi:MAG: hypothetical protein AAB658_09330, partial [Chloroflexota bacterium]
IGASSEINGRVLINGFFKLDPRARKQLCPIIARVIQILQMGVIGIEEMGNPVHAGVEQRLHLERKTIAAMREKPGHHRFDCLENVAGSPKSVLERFFAGQNVRAVLFENVKQVDQHNILAALDPVVDLYDFNLAVRVAFLHHLRHDFIGWRIGSGPDKRNFLVSVPKQWNAGWFGRQFNCRPIGLARQYFLRHG